MVVGFSGGASMLVLRFTLDSYMCCGDFISITTDASIYCLGGVLEVNGSIVSWFSSEVFEADVTVLGLCSPLCAKDQQVLEALAILVALRAWKHYWTSTRLTLAFHRQHVSFGACCKDATALAAAR